MVIILTNSLGWILITPKSYQLIAWFFALLKINSPTREAIPIKMANHEIKP